MGKFHVLTDGSYTGGLSWLHRFEAEIEPTGDVQASATKEDVTDEFYTVIFPDSVDGASLLDDCDCVLSCEPA